MQGNKAGSGNASILPGYILKSAKEINTTQMIKKIPVF